MTIFECNRVMITKFNFNKSLQQESFLDFNKVTIPLALKRGME